MGKIGGVLDLYWSGSGLTDELFTNVNFEFGELYVFL